MGVLKKPFFRGQSINRLDAKGRLRIPTKFREVLQQNYTDALIVTLLGNCLVAYPPEIWEEEVESRVRGFSQVKPDEREAKRRLIAYSEECEFDGHGRILISPILRQKARLDQEVVLVGMLESFEIWDKDTWDRHEDVSEDRYREIMSTAAEAGL